MKEQYEMALVEPMKDHPAEVVMKGCSFARDEEEIGKE